MEGENKYLSDEIELALYFHQTPFNKPPIRWTFYQTVAVKQYLNRKNEKLDAATGSGKGDVYKNFGTVPPHKRK